MTEQQINALYRIIGARIREAREKNHINHDQLAQKVGISRSSVVNIEKGRQRLPLHLMWDIADELGVEPYNFIPSRSDIHKQPITNEIDDKTLKMIDEKSQGNPEIRKKMIEFYLTDL